jgi:hypothetical protein
MQLLDIILFLNSIAISAKSDELACKIGPWSSPGYDLIKQWQSGPKMKRWPKTVTIECLKLYTVANESFKL